MISNEWKRICGLHIAKDGTMAGVWLAHDTDTDTVHLWDAANFDNEVPVVIAEGLNARGRDAPVAWRKKKKTLANQLKERGCNMLHDPVDEEVVDTVAREIRERIRTSRFKVDKRLKNWQEEYVKFQRDGDSDEFPLMAATINAVAMLDRARGKPKRRRQQQRYPQMSIA